MADRPSKRARAASNSETPTTAPDSARLARLPELLDTLDEKTIRRLLLVAAKENSRVAELIEIQADNLKAIERTKTIDFDYHSKSVWRTLNVQYAKLKSSHQYQMSGEAFESVSSCIEDIRDRCPPYASYVTKFSALETLRKIGKTIIMSNDDELGREVQNDFGHDTVIEDAIKDIIEPMTSEERKDLMQEPCGDMIWMDKLKELHNLGEDYGIFESLADVIALLEDGTRSSRQTIEVVDLLNDD